MKLTLVLFFLGFVLMAPDLRAGGNFSYEETYSGTGREGKTRREAVYEEIDGKKEVVFERIYSVSSNQVLSSSFRPPGGAMTNYNEGVPNQRIIVQDYLAQARAPSDLAGEGKLDPKYIDATTRPSLKTRLVYAAVAALLALGVLARMFRRRA